MKKILLISLLSLTFSNYFGQIDSLKTSKYSIADYYFKKKYQKKEYSKFSLSQIKIEKNKIIFDKIKSIEIPENLEKEYRLIIENGLINPTFLNTSNNIEVCCFSRLNLLEPNIQTRRYKFWIFKQKQQNSNATELEKKISNTINPQEYYFEIQNDSAYKGMPIDELIKGSKLTYITFGTIII